ncbi:hypothetical protein B7P43_G02585 [Cryptotermes secundus]|uniref:Uncharacterized protein n=2 Tax=Cryptotermes secundus TaxID=105785 RepID=A0A2J7R3D3_9NEOP|nr:hypothetical protein B7P43_G02585 [Cryptotermes secundus]
MRGSEGLKGDRGDRGFPGEPGLRGPPGMHGAPGPKGDKAPPGLDGRDGVPGEPGLDGIPGRNGLDGMPGLNGYDGMPGLPGINGTNGLPGETGPQGPPGPKGPRGLTGPRGRPGKPGTNGVPGVPGINAWTVKVNGTTINELLIPPSIAAPEGLPSLNPIIVHEGGNVRLRCAATGIPRPAVEWRKLDGSVIPLGSWQAVSVSGHTLNITRVNRGHMGIYNCIADNGVPPSANQTFNLEVHFPPLIRIQNQLVGVANGSSGVLKCDVEAFPEAVRYWERGDGRLLESGDKYHMTYNENGRYKVHMQLTITNVGPADFGPYHCIAKNEMGITKGIFTMFEIDPRLATPPTVQISGQGEVTYGEGPPKPVDLDDLCPPPSCPECPAPTEFKCHDGGISLFHLIGRMEIKPFGNETYKGIPARILDCQLYAVGKPVYHRYTNMSYGSWMRDPQPSTETGGQKFWFTNESDPYHLYEYENKTLFRAGTPSVTYTLDHPFKGNAHVIYNGSFYYNELNNPHIRKYVLATKNTHVLNVPMVATKGNNYLYTTNYNYMDFSVDENGLWVIYGIPSTNHTVVMKVNTDHKMETEYMWNISINNHLFGEMFVACGVLYAVDSITERNSKIRFALDLYKNQLLDVNLPFTNPFRGTTMVGYNHKNKELFTWDKGNQLTYPIRYHEIGYNTSKEDKGEPETSPLVQTGYDVYS